MKNTPFALPCLVYALALLVLASSFTSSADAEPIRDDFSDGSIADGSPIAWDAIGSTISFGEDGLQLSGENGNPAIVSVEDANSTGWSMRIRAKQEDGDITGVGTTSNDPVTWSHFNPSGRLNIGEGGGNVLDFDLTDIDPSEYFILQLDTFDDKLEAWAWPADSVPTSTEPILSVSFRTLPNSSPAFWVRDLDNGFAESTFRWFEYSDEHIPIPVPEPDACQLILIGLSLLGVRRRSMHR